MAFETSSIGFIEDGGGGGGSHRVWHIECEIVGARHILSTCCDC